MTLSATDIAIAVGTTLSGVAATLALIAAVVAARRFKGQFDQAERHHKDQMTQLEEARKDALRPAIDVGWSGIERSGIPHPDQPWDLPLVNFGVGPARSVAVSLWVTIRGSQSRGGATEWDSTVEEDEPWWQGGTTTLGAMKDAQAVRVFRNHEEPLPEDEVIIWALIRYADLYDRTYENRVHRSYGRPTVPIKLI